MSPDARRRDALRGSGADEDAGWAPRGGEDARGDSTYPEEETDMKSVDVKVSGVVQGVYYRASARREGALSRPARLGAQRRATAPSRLRLQGDPAAVDAMLDWCRVGPPAARVSRLTVDDAPADETSARLRGEIDAGPHETPSGSPDAGRRAPRPRGAGVRAQGRREPRRARLHRARPAARGIVAGIAQNVLLQLGHPPRTAELAAIAGYLHDIGNGINRLDHGIAAALLSRHILERLGMGPDEYAEVMCAIGNHEEEYGEAVSPLAAAVILGDKSDVHRSRVRVIDPETDDIHDRVNMATTRSFLAVDARGAHHHAGARDRHRASSRSCSTSRSSSTAW